MVLLSGQLRGRKHSEVLSQQVFHLPEKRVVLESGVEICCKRRSLLYHCLWSRQAVDDLFLSWTKHQNAGKYSHAGRNVPIYGTQLFRAEVLCFPPRVGRARIQKCKRHPWMSIDRKNRINNDKKVRTFLSLLN